MNKRAMISQPMAGKTDEEIAEARERAHVRPRELCDEYAPGDPLRMAMREYWKEAEADGC